MSEKGREINESDPDLPVDGEAAEPVDGEAAEPVDGEAAEPVDGEAAEPVDGEAAEPVDGEAAEPVDGDEESVEDLSLPQGLVAGDGEEGVLEAGLTERDFHKNMVEAAIFIASNPVSVEELALKLDLKKKEVEELVQELAIDYLDRVSAIEIVQIGDRFTMQVKPEYTEHVSKFSEGGLIPEAIMRTLTIIALKQPIMKSTVVKLRGSGAYQHVKYLIEHGLVEAIKKGRSSELYTTDQFADMFGFPRDVNRLKAALKAQLGVRE
ncbi:MAG: hypothetical protein Kow0069_10940 [Promethearchaeota archaeon]